MLCCTAVDELATAPVLAPALVLEPSPALDPVFSPPPMLTDVPVLEDPLRMPPRLIPSEDAATIEKRAAMLPRTIAVAVNLFILITGKTEIESLKGDPKTVAFDSPFPL